MRHLLFKLTFFLLLLYGLHSFSLSHIPFLAAQILKTLNLPAVTFSLETLSLFQARISNIQLDDPVSVRLNSLNLSYSPVSILKFQTLKDVDIDRIQITLNDNSTSPTQEADSSPLTIPDIPFESLSVNHATLIFPKPFFGDYCEFKIGALFDKNSSHLELTIASLDPSPPISINVHTNLQTLNAEFSINFDLNQIVDLPINLRGSLKGKLELSQFPEVINIKDLQINFPEIPGFQCQGFIELRRENGLYHFTSAQSQLRMTIQSSFIQFLNSTFNLTLNDFDVSALLTPSGSEKDCQISIPVRLPENGITYQNLNLKGNLHFNLKYKSLDTDSLIAEISLQEGNASLENMYAEKIQGKLQFNLLNLFASPTQIIHIETLNYPPFKFENSRLSLRLLNENTLFVDSFQSSWCEGKLTAQSFEVKKNPLSIQMDLLCDHIKAKELLTLFPQKNLSASGEFYGRLPIVFKNNKIYLKDGFLYTTPDGGFIKAESFLLSSLANDNPELKKQLKLADTALQDFNFEKIQFKISGTQDNISLLYHIKGNSNKKGIPPVDLKITVEGAIQALVNQLLKINQKMTLD